MDQKKLDEYFKAALKIVQQAGFIVQEGFNSVKKVELKTGHNDLVTEYDRKVETFIKEKLEEVAPDVLFLGEETSNKKITLGNNPTWILDPIDGTNSFVHGYPQTAISLALTVDKEPIIGIIHSPMEAKTYWAVKGKGSFYNGFPIHTSDVKDLKQALVGLEISLGGKGKELLEKLSEREKACVTTTVGVRSVGCAALGLCYVAHGMWDVYHTEGLAIWDYAAGVLIIREAGGTVLDSHGDQFDLLSSRILAAANNELGGKVAQLFKDVDQK